MNGIDHNHVGKLPEEKNNIKPNGNLVQVNSFVWAKMKGYPHWPGKVLKEEYKLKKSEDEETKARFFWVYFFGSHDHSWIEEKYVCLYIDGKEIYGKLDLGKNRKITPKRKKDFELGVEEIEFSLKEAPFQADLEWLQRKHKIQKPGGKVLGVLGYGSLYIAILRRCAEAFICRVPGWDVRKVIARLGKSSKAMNFGIRKQLMNFEEDVYEIIKKSDVLVSCYPHMGALEASINLKKVSKEMMEFKTYIEMTPVDIKTGDRNSKVIKKLGGTYIRAPVLYPETFTEENKIAIMLCGKYANAHVTNIFRFIKVFASPITTFNGEKCRTVATKTSLILQMMMGNAIASLAESLSLASEVGLDQSSLMEIFRMIMKDCPLISNRGCALLTSNDNLLAVEKCMKNALCMGSEILESLPVSYAALSVLRQNRKRKANKKKTVPERNTRYKCGPEKPHMDEDKDPERPLVVIQDKDPEKILVDMQDKDPEKPIVGTQDKDPGRLLVDMQDKDPERLLVDMQDKDPERPIVVMQDKDSERPVVGTQDKDPERPLVDMQDKDSERSLVGTQDKDPEIPIMDMQDKDYERPVVGMQDKDSERPVVGIQDKDSERPVVGIQDKDPVDESSNFVNASQYNESDGKEDILKRRTNYKHVIEKPKHETLKEKSLISVNMSQYRQSDRKRPDRQELFPERNAKYKCVSEKRLVNLQNGMPVRETPFFINTSLYKENGKPVKKNSIDTSQSSDSDESDSELVFISRYPSDAMKVNKVRSRRCVPLIKSKG